MRTTLTLLVLVTACTSAPPSGEATYHSVRDRLAAEPTRMFIGSDGSSGSITAQRYSKDGWVDGTTALQIANGEFIATVDHTGQLAVTAFGVGVDPIDVPESVFGKPAQLRDVRVKLTKQEAAQTTWTDDDDATATAMLDLDLSWTISVGDATTPLGTQHLPPVPVDVTLTGAGDHVDAQLSLHASGELWSWAGILKLTKLDLTLAGATVD